MGSPVDTTENGPAMDSASSDDVYQLAVPDETPQTAGPSQALEQRLGERAGKTRTGPQLSGATVEEIGRAHV